MTLSSTASGPESYLPSSEEWSQLGAKFNVDGKAPTLPAHYYPLESYVFPFVDRLLSTTQLVPVNILLLAGGTGAELELLLQHYEMNGENFGRLKVVQSDASSGMLQVAQKMVQDHVWDKVVEIRLLNAQKIDHPDNFFDVVLLLYGPHCLPDPQAGMKVALRVAKPGGLTLFSTPFDLTVWDLFSQARNNILASRKHRVPPQTALRHIFKDHQAIGQWTHLDWVHKTYKQLPGFENVCIETNTVTTTMSNYRQSFEAMFENPGLRFIYAELSDEEVASMRTEIFRLADARIQEAERPNHDLECEITSAIAKLIKE